MKKSFSNIPQMKASIAFIGGAAYDQATVLPIWNTAPARLASVFQGKFGFQTVNFWKSTDLLTILLSVALLILAGVLLHGLSVKTEAK